MLSCVFVNSLNKPVINAAAGYDAASARRLSLASAAKKLLVPGNLELSQTDKAFTLNRYTLMLCV